MKKFGFGKKGEGKKGDSSDNPYAQQPAEDAYSAPTAPMTPYQQARQNVNVGLPAGGPRMGGLPGGPGPRDNSYGTPPPPYPNGQQQQSGYGNEKIGASQGYGDDRYGVNANAYSANRQAPSIANQPPARRPGGYGGLDDNDGNRDALFAGAKDRYTPQQSRYPASGSGGYDDSSAAASGSFDGYGQQRELTQEEQEEQSVQSIKDETNAIRQESLNTTRRAVQTSRQAIETMSSTYARLGAQEERLHNMEKNLDLAAISNKVGEERAKELKRINGSMISFGGNPFTSKQRAIKREAELQDSWQREREEREQTRRDAYAGNQEAERGYNEMFKQPQQLGLGSKSKADLNKYVFEDDDDGTQAKIEEELEGDLVELSSNLKTLKTGAVGMGRMVDRQNGLIDRIGEKSDAVDDGVRMNRDRLGRIR